MLLTTEKLTKRFGDLTALDEINFDVEEGVLKAIIGPNGAGKTTFFNLLTGQITPTSGRVYFRGEDITGLPPHKCTALGIGRSFQITNIFPELTVRENLQVAAQRRLERPWNFYQRADSLEDIHRQCESILDDLGLLNAIEEKADTLSHGDKRHLEIGITLATQPEIILLDEPTAGMSPEETTQTIELIDDLSSDHTILLVEHDMDVVSQVSDKIMVMNQGRKLVEGPPSTVLNDERVQEAYLGGL